MVKNLILMFVFSSSLAVAGDSGADMLNKEDFIGYFINYKNILGNKIGRIDNRLEDACKRGEVKMLRPFSHNGYSYVYACKIDKVRFLIGINDETPKKLVNDFILVTSLDLYDMVNEKVVGKYGKCKFPRETPTYSTCTYSIGIDPSTKLGRIVTFEKDAEKKATMYMLSVESGDGI